jgi:hypothetical protein
MEYYMPLEKVRTMSRMITLIDNSQPDLGLPERICLFEGAREDKALMQ